ncbi:MAG: peptidyl-prolyl cis-trans isomerase C [Halieaceae bacterium]|jgi:peptidyl-prolyl cis-trans isomerase C
MRITLFFFLAITLLSGRSVAETAADDVVVSDGGVAITRAEFEAVLTASPGKIRRLAASDMGDRFELINTLISTRKLAAAADELPPTDPRYWDLQFQLQSIKAKFYFDRLLEEISVGNVEPLAREYYRTRKDEYALQNETRASSHILFRARPGEDRVPVRESAQAVLEALRAGADFAAMVQEHSADKGTAARGGSLDRWVTLGDPTLTPPYTGALFEIESEGEYSAITESQFGVHIVRFDGVRPRHYLPFEEVSGKIMADIAMDVRRLVSKEIRSRYNVSEEAFIDGAAMEELFAPY